jgi:hypothetical protein
VGNDAPLSYVLPALALKATSTASTGLGVNRLVAACACLAFVLLSMVLLWDGSVWSLLGWLITLTPMVLFVTSIINPNGLEIASSLAFAAAVLRVVGDPARVSTWVGVALSAAGAVAILSW